MSMAVWLGGFGLFFGIIALIAAAVVIILIYIVRKEGPTGPAGPTVTYKYNKVEEKSITSSDNTSDFVPSTLYYLTTTADLDFMLKNADGLTAGDTLTIFNGSTSSIITVKTDSSLQGIEKYPSGYELIVGEAVNLTYRTQAGSNPILVPTSNLINTS